KPDLVINIIDATNLERNLYLTTQLLEMRIPLIIALNMMDLAEQKKIRIEIEHLAEHLGCKVIPVVASKKVGIDLLRNELIRAAESHQISPTRVVYDSVVEEALERIYPLTQNYAESHLVDNRWLAIKLLEGDELAKKITQGTLEQEIKPDISRIEKHTNMNIDLLMADGRYGFIHGLTRDILHREKDPRKDLTEMIDNFVLNKYLSLPIFLGIMYLVFTLTIKVGMPFIDFFDSISGAIFVDGSAQLFNSLGSPAWLVVFLSAGVGGGIQTVATFIPPIFFMFFSLAILEDSGYMSRAAFVMDRYMRIIGLPGKAFIPLILGFGCNVPAILAARTLENRRDRLVTILINPLMSCGARLPVYALFASVFFRENGGVIIFILYLTGIILAIISGLLFNSTLFKGKISTFVMELPPYHIPTFNGIMLHTWQRLKGFIIRAGKVIIGFIILLSFLSSIGTDGKFGVIELEDSILSHLGRKLTPVFKPTGITDDNWPATVGLITGIFAKETVVSTLRSLYQNTEQVVSESEGIRESISNSFITLYADITGRSEQEELEFSDFEEKLRLNFGGLNNAFSYLLFVLIYMPCVGVVAAIQREAGWRWALFSVIYLTVLAWIVSTLFFQISRIHVATAESTFWITICLASTGLFYLLFRKFGASSSGEKAIR
ncbi:MAG: ferrous iron transport protein B, partial [Candidatus Cloacimonetes bacterium]|nr:ferrous iron transport protein B [Candidatus Cloacimonadota bacterium]